MTSNTIPERQNQPEFMRFLRARSEIYRRASQLQLIQLIFTVAVPVISAVIGLCFPSTRPFVAMTAIGVTIIDVAVLDRCLKRRLKTAALVCEEFDCRLLDIPWNKFVAGRHLEPETIIEADRLWSRGNSKLNNWYPEIVGLVPICLARIICQRTNLWYDAKLRDRYGNFLLIIAMFITIALIVAGLATNLSFDDFVVTILAPCGSLLVWALRESFKQRDAADAQKTARSEAEALWTLALTGECSDDECAARSREFQNTIFQRRISNPLIFPWLYNLLRNGMETDMNLAAEDFLEQARVAGRI